MSRQALPTQLRDHLGNEIRLAPKPFAVGGEGAIYDVLGRPDLVAKLYSKPPGRERCDKLRAMAKLTSPELLKIAAWPTATLLSGGNRSVVDGILMPRIAGYFEIHHLYSVAQRKKDFPEADWGFLLHTARNCAIAFETVHQHGHVVGDVNQKNVMVSKKGIVAFVDCDSFQVAEGSRIFRCAVGVPEYTPPELHGKNFASLDRAANHDLFGLAVLIFHLLMMGRHPFSGVPLVKADLPIEKAIQEGDYAYTHNTATARLRPPPHVPPVTMLGASLLSLFERAFCTPRRPTATDWHTSLDAALKQLVRCKSDSKHSYLTIAGKCPWCELITVARLMFFLPGQIAAAATFRPEEIHGLVQKLIGLELVFAPYTRPHPPSPVRVSPPPGLAAPSPKPPLIPRPAVPAPLPKPSLKVYPLAPAGPPRPKLAPLPQAPAYPPLPSPSPPDPFLRRLCVAGFIAGYVVVFIAMPVGVIMIAAFAAWWILMLATDKPRQEAARRVLKEAHQLECDRIAEEYAELCRPTEIANERLNAVWKAANDAHLAEYARVCERIDEENDHRLTEWDTATKARVAEHAHSCNQIDAINRRRIAEWETANAPWIAEVKRWQQRLADAESALGKLEAELFNQRSSSQVRLHHRKKEAQGVLSSHEQVMESYAKELRQAEVDSKKIQLEEHLDKFLIRDAKLKAITNERVLSLESFGIQTANDVAMLNSQKVPGIGPVLSNRLFAWRDGLVASFVPKQSVPESQRNRIAGRYGPVLMPLGQTLQEAIRDLDGIIKAHHIGEGQMRNAIMKGAQQMAIAAAHLDALNKMS